MRGISRLRNEEEEEVKGVYSMPDQPMGPWGRGPGPRAPRLGEAPHLEDASK